jgi:hypothetical protein
VSARPTAEQIIQMLRPEELQVVQVHGHTLVMVDVEEDDYDEEYDPDYDEEVEDEEPDYDIFPVCPICMSDWEYIGITNRAECERGHRWNEVA